MIRGKSLGLSGYLPGAIVGFALIVIILLWGGIFALNARERERAMVETETGNANLARAFEEHFVRSFNYVDQLALLVKAQYERHGAALDLPKFVKEINLNSELINNIVVTDEHDMVVLGAVNFRRAYLGDREHVQVHHAGGSQGLFISRPVMTRLAGKWSIVATRRINKPDGSFAGVVGVAVDPNYFTSFYKQLDLGRHGIVALIGTTDGILRARLPELEPGTPVRDFRNGELFGMLKDRDYGNYIATSNVDNVVRIYSYRVLRDYPLVVTVGSSEALAFAAARENQGYYILAGILVSLIVVVSAWGLIALAERQARFAGELNDRRSRLVAQQAALMEMIAPQSRSSSELAPLFVGYTRQIAQTLGVERVSVWRFTADRRSIFCVQMHELTPGRDSSGAELAVRAFPDYFSALASQSIVAADDALADPRTRALDDIYLKPNNIGSMLNAGFDIFGQPGGVVCCEHVGGTRHWSIDEQSFILAASNLVSLSYEKREREQAEKTMVETQAFLDSVIENIPDMIFIKDAHALRFVRLNKAGEELMGYSREALIGKNDRDFFPAEIAEFYIRKDRETLASGEVLDIEVEPIQTRAQGMRYLHTKKIPIFDDTGEPRYLLGISEDITDRHLAEEALRASEARLKAVMDHSLALISLKDIEGRYLMINRPYAEMLKLSPEEAVGQHADQVFPPELAASIEAQHELVRVRHVANTTEQNMLTSEGARTYLSVMFPLLDASGELFAIGSVSTDITQRKLDELRLQQMNLAWQRNARELVAANKELEAFTYTVSHDLRAPLRHIDGFIDLLVRHSADSLDEKSRGYLERVSRAALRMGLLIDNLLAFSRVSRAEFVRKKVALSQLIEEVVEESMVDIGDRHVHWDIDALPDVYGDATLLRVAFGNLVDNAVKYTRRKEVAKIEIKTMHANATEAVVCIRDNGAGFDMQYMDKLFGVFQRLHGVEEFEGTGIGLASVARIVQRHGGRVWAESCVGEWAAFYVAIPVAEERRSRFANLI
jgi:PAS domain S-box-containing protein